MARVIRKKTEAGKALDKALSEMGDAQAKVGWFESAKYEDGTSIAYVASIQEFGSPQKSIPPRPFMRKTIADKSPEWKALLASASKAIIAGNETIHSALTKIAGLVTGDVHKTISELQAPALKAATIKARLRRRADKRSVGNLTKPLIDTGKLIDTLTFVVEDKK